MNDNESTELLIYAETVEAGPNADLTRHDDCAPGATSDQAQGDRADLESADLDREDLLIRQNERYPGNGTQPPNKPQPSMRQMDLFP